ncbi:unnamed protein product [Clavelina lepadiformis]|uniref:Uncharacterized protein n=1 Tax=Clavelina lepadiformis TaxID=159417 RepID=A0ABP0FMW2_CLALP
MGDSSETGSVATTTTAILFRPGYFCTLSGFLKLEELVSGIFCWVLVVLRPFLFIRRLRDVMVQGAMARHRNLFQYFFRAFLRFHPGCRNCVRELRHSTAHRVDDFCLRHNRDLPISYFSSVDATAYKKWDKSGQFQNWVTRHNQ